MADLPKITGSDAVRVFERFGFVHVRSKGSHRILKKPGHRYTLSVPDHGHTPLGAGLLRSLVRNAGLTVEEFVAQI